MERGSATPPRDDPHSLAPVQIEVGDIEEDVAQLKQGKGARLLITVLFSGVAVFGAVQWMEQIDGARAYAAAAERLETINAQQGTAFLRCVLPDVQRSHLASRQALHNALESASERARKHYGKQLRHCSVLSDKLAQQLEGLQVPADMHRGTLAMRTAAGELNQALASYRAYLLDPSLPYDFVQATPMIERIADAWMTYEERRTALNAALRER